MTTRLLWLPILALTLSACGSAGSDTATPDPTATATVPATAGTWRGEENGAAACGLLDTATLQTVTGRDGWTVTSDEWSYCQFGNGDDILDLQVLAIEAYDSLAGVTDRGKVKVVQAGDGVSEAWTQAGGPSYGGDFLEGTIGIRQTPVQLDEDTLTSLVYEAALNHENSPVTSFKRDGVLLSAEEATTASPSVEYNSELTSVWMEGAVASTGKTFSIEVTADDVEAASSPATVMIYCVGGVADQSDAPITSNLYFVAATDLRITSGVTNFALSAADVDGPGTYSADMDIGQADGSSFSFEGEIQIAEGMLTGTYRMDAQGTTVDGQWECRV